MKLLARGLVAVAVVLTSVGCQCGDVKPKVDPLSIVVEPATISVDVGATTQLRAHRVNGEDVTDQVTWIPTDPSLANVDRGLVTALAVGSLPIVATLGDYGDVADVTISDVVLLAAACADVQQNGTETDVDCGGTACPRCADGQRCQAGTDCSSNACTEGRCQPASCTDGLLNGTETGPDCGGGCPACEPGLRCRSGADCASQVCQGGVCRPPSCADGVQNADETDVDCGGASCSPCSAGGTCTTSSDCAVGTCVNGHCQQDSCTDGFQNGTETSVDCGGASCAPCDLGLTCVLDSDCASTICLAGACVAPSCSDQRRNGDETGPDCGGPSCPACTPGLTCNLDHDCFSGVCRDRACQAATCTDGARNGDETGADCGGSTCGPCTVGETCLNGSDCASLVCVGGVCLAPTCTDALQNGLETGVDCGAGACPLCADGAGCASGANCLSGSCSNGQCVPPSCTDGVLNGAETYLDCGGAQCAPCGTGQVCLSASDCVSLVCTSSACQAATCLDRVRNGTETDVDCGGSCASCGSGATCRLDADCASGHCAGGTCGAAIVRSLLVSPTALTLPVGHTQAFTALEQRSDGTTRDVTTTASWSTSNVAAATLSSTGLLEAVAQGTTVVRAASAGFTSNPVTVTVTAAVLERLEVTPTGVVLPIGLIEPYQARGTYSDGRVVDLTSAVAWTSAVPTVASIAADGRATGLSPGDTELIASLAGLSARTTLTVSSVTISALTVDPPTLTLPIGVRGALAATALLSDGSARDVTTQATWSSASPGIVTVDTGTPQAGLVTGLTAGTAKVSATLSGFTAMTGVTIVDATVTLVQVFPANETVPRGFELHYAAVGLFTDGNAYDLTLSADWGSTTPAVASVGNTFPEQGLVRTLTVGATRIAASFGGERGDTALTVNDATLTALSVTPALLTLPVGAARQYRATGVFSDGTARDVTTLAAWQSSNLAVARVSTTTGTIGRVTALAGGTATLTASLGGLVAHGQLRVTTAALEAISLSPPSVRIGLQGVVNFTATAVYADGTALDVTESAGWTSSVPSVASVRNDTGYRGIALGLSSGATTITARYGGLAGAARVSVSNAQLQDLYISPAVVRTGLGIDVQFSLSGLWGDGTTSDLTRVATWTSSQRAVAVISNAIGSHGLATTLGVGETTIGASWAGQVDSTTLTVTNARLTTITVTPSVATTGAGAQLQLRALATFDDGTTFDVTTIAAWSSSNEAVASVSSATGVAGLVTAIQGGTVILTARLGIAVGTATLTVSGAALVGLHVTPLSAVVPLGYWRQYLVTAEYADGLTVDVTRVATWTTGTPTVASVGIGALYGGRVTGLTEGDSSVVARFGAFRATATATVMDLRLANLTLSPDNQSTPVGVPLQLTAMGTFTGGGLTIELDLTQQVGWKVAPKKNGTISNSEGSRGVVTMYNASSAANILAQAVGGSMTGNTKVNAP